MWTMSIEVLNPYEAITVRGQKDNDTCCENKENNCK